MVKPIVIVDSMATIPIIELVSVSDSLVNISSDICNNRTRLTPKAIPIRKPIPWS